tara:strand:+ start:179 stop:592 length:414 start_codon:yes stop_codon:yes gene_type:complete
MRFFRVSKLILYFLQFLDGWMFIFITKQMKAGVGNKRTYNGLGHRRNTTSTKQKKEKQRAYRVLKSEKLRIQATKDLESTKSIKLAVDAPHVAIVGGGAAGLASLRCLLALGCNVTLFDRVSLSKQKEIIFIFVTKI